MSRGAARGGDFRSEAEKIQPVPLDTFARINLEVGEVTPMVGPPLDCAFVVAADASPLYIPADGRKVTRNRKNFLHYRG